jgi:hypothetical protein
MLRSFAGAASWVGLDFPERPPARFHASKVESDPTHSEANAVSAFYAARRRAFADKTYFWMS